MFAEGVAWGENVWAGIEESTRREPGTPLPLPLRREQHWEAHHAQPHWPCHRWAPTEYRIRVTFFLDPDPVFHIDAYRYLLVAIIKLTIPDPRHVRADPDPVSHIDAYRYRYPDPYPHPAFPIAKLNFYFYERHLFTDLPHIVDHVMACSPIQSFWNCSL